jgi:glycosyltransferase involved in cell wall biosynthesis
MKVLFDHASPFFLAHGGFQIQIEQTKSALESIGLDVEFLRWWDASQKGDVIHFFGRPSPDYIEFAQAKNIKVVFTDLLAGVASRRLFARTLQRTLTAISRDWLPRQVTARLGWRSYRLADACVALTVWEASLMQSIFAAPKEKVHVVPNAVEAVFFDQPAISRGPWLVCTATIQPGKRVLELAQAAVGAETPLWIVGKPYSANDAYAKTFFDYVRTHKNIVRYEGPVNDRQQLAQVYRSARGFVLLSECETLSLSALEAAACECPLLLSDLPWATSVFADNSSYCPVNASVTSTAKGLRRFYDAAPTLDTPPKPLRWVDVAKQLAAIYTSVVKTSS